MVRPCRRRLWWECGVDGGAVAGFPGPGDRSGGIVNVESIKDIFAYLVYI